MQFAYTGYKTGAYIAPGSTDVTFQTPSEVEILFAPALQKLCTLYLEAYDRGSKSTLESGPGGPEFRQKRPHEGTERGAKVLGLFP